MSSDLVSLLFIGLKTVTVLSAMVRIDIHVQFGTARLDLQTILSTTLDKLLARWSIHDRKRQQFRDLNIMWLHVRTVHDLLQSRSFARIVLQYGLYQSLSQWIYNHMFREFVIIVFDPFVSSFDFLGFEWRSTYQHCIEDHTDRPYIYFKRMAFTFQYFRCDIIGSPTNCFSLFMRTVQLSSKS